MHIGADNCSCHRLVHSRGTRSGRSRPQLRHARGNRPAPGSHTVLELELKAVVADPDQLREALSQVATLSFEGMLRDQRFDFDTGGITRRDEVVRIRRWEGRDGTVREQLAWKGPAHLVDGYK